MKKTLPLLFALVYCMMSFTTAAQCSGGQTNCTINWDYLKFFPSAGLGTYTTLATSQTQNFAFGTQKMTITHNYTGSNAVGEDALNTAEAGSFGAGADVHFIGNGQIVVTFQTGVDNVRFSMYDIDRSQRVVISSPGFTNVTLARINANVLTFSNNSTNSARADANNNTPDNTNVDGTMNVSITGLLPIITFTITVTNTGTNGSEFGDFWLSDITACTGGLFANNYYQVSKPFTGQPGYVIVSRQDSFYFVNPVNGVAKYLFYDPGHTNVNSVAYDPVKHYVYYVFSLSGPGGTINSANKTLRRYNYDKDTFGVVMNDITSLMPTFEQGIESGAAGFYDGSLYLGLEAKSTGAYKSIVWKVDFNASDVPVSASQVYGIAGASHDWGDLCVVNGVLYDFDASAAIPNYYHQNLYTHNVTNYTPTGSDIPRQAAVDWNNNIYNVGAPNVANPPGSIAPYNLNGTVNTGAIQTITENSISVTGSWGDAGEAFKPRLDFGDAPASYDPATGDPAVHEISGKLYLGIAKDDEWTTRGQTTLATSDNFDDGLISSSLVNPSAGTYFAQVKYFNNTGATATVCAWVDFNGNGKYDATEGLVQTNLPSSASAQTAFFNWTGMASPLTNGSYTYLRLRITTVANNLTTAKATGYFDNGEVEDYRIVVTTYPLATQLVKFTAKKTQTNVAVDWQVTNEELNLSYTVQRSRDAQNWTNLSSFKAAQNNATKDYTYQDASPLKGTSFYRLKMEHNGIVYSLINKITINEGASIQLQPNPATDFVKLTVTTETPGILQLQIRDAAGRMVQQKNISINAGLTSLPITLVSLSSGVYWVQIQVGATHYSEKIIVNK